MKEHPQEKMTIKITGSLLSAPLSNIPTHLLYMDTHAYKHKYSLSYLSVRPLPLFVIFCSALSSTFIFFYQNYFIAQFV